MRPEELLHLSAIHIAALTNSDVVLSSLWGMCREGARARGACLRGRTMLLEGGLQSNTSSTSSSNIQKKASASCESNRREPMCGFPGDAGRSTLSHSSFSFAGITACSGDQRRAECMLLDWLTALSSIETPAITRAVQGTTSGCIFCRAE